MAYVTINKHNEALRRIADLEAKLASCMSTLHELSCWVEEPWRSIASAALAKTETHATWTD